MKSLGANFWKQQADGPKAVISEEFRSLLACPDDDAVLELNPVAGEFVCPGCGRKAAVIDGYLPLLPSDDPYRLRQEEITTLSGAGKEREASDPRDRYRRLWPKIAELCGALQGKRVLDLCCGSGWAAAWFAAQGAQVAAGDIVAGEGGLRDAVARREAGSAFFDLFQLDVCRIPFQPEVFDLVFISDAIHLLRRPERLLKEVGRVLKPNGVLVNPGEPIGSAGSMGVGDTDPRARGGKLTLADYLGIYREGELLLERISAADNVTAKKGLMGSIMADMSGAANEQEVFFVGRRPPQFRWPTIRLPWRRKEIH